MKKRNLWMVMSLVLAVCLSAAASAGFVPLQNYDQQFDYSLCGDPTQATAYATVHSWVEHDDEAGIYRYLYQIHSVAADYRISYFQIPVYEEPISNSFGMDTSYPGSVSGYIFANWYPLTQQDESVYGAGAFFTSAVTAGSNSVVLRIDSYGTPGQAGGLLSGFGPNGVVSLCGDVFVPVPEPTTLLLLVSGAALVMRKKHS